MIGFDQLELMIVFDQSGHVLVFIFWPIRAHASFCQIRSKAQASFSPIWTEKKRKPNMAHFWRVFTFLLRVQLWFAQCRFSLRLLSSATRVYFIVFVTRRLSTINSSYPRPFYPEEILSRRCMFRIKHCHHLRISCSNITFFCFLVRHGLPSEWGCSRCSISHDSWTWKATRSCYCGERRKSEF